MAKKKPEPQFFTTVTDMQAVPIEKIDLFCEDLRLWLHMHAQIAAIEKLAGVKLQVVTPRESFGWHDDGRHDVTLNISLKA